MRQRFDVIVVGGGIVGCAIAYYLTGLRASVAVLERGEVGGEASGAAAGMLIAPPWAAPASPFGDLCRSSLHLYPSLVERVQAVTGIDVQFVTTGLLVPAETEGAAAALRQATQWRGGPMPDMEWVEGEALRALEPELSPRLFGAAYSSRQHHVNPGLMTQALARAAEARGATLFPGTSVERYVRRRQRVVAVRTTEGTMAADHLVLAAGPWTGRLARPLGVRVPVRPVRGQMLAYRERRVRNIVGGTGGYLVPKPGGFLFAGATVEDVGFRRRTTRRGIAWLRSMAGSLVPSLRYAEVASTWAGLRPGSPDDMPILGRLPGWTNVYVATGHFRNGVLLAPVTGKVMAELIVRGKTDAALAPFRVERFRPMKAG
ncbi:MAG: glycine oxidase ThiO [Chloroflexi bacterium]|nr:glycine oxidase ThiO [Chloroflexota bacterium]